jgi:hypothetical protein
LGERFHLTVELITSRNAGVEFLAAMPEDSWMRLAGALGAAVGR